MQSKKTVVLTSGGLDSTTLLHLLVSEVVKPQSILALSFLYGQKHRKELDYARWNCQVLHVDHRVVDLSSVGNLLSSSLIDPKQEIPSGHYAEDSMKATIVPNRNAIMLSIAFGVAESVGADTVAYAAHSGDHFIYPDCRPEFVRAFEDATVLAIGHPMSLYAPFLFMGKSDIVRLGDELGVDFTRTWSCYRGWETHCGECGTCVERKEAFELAEVPDPTEYSA